MPITLRIILDGLRPYASMSAFLAVFIASNILTWFLALWTSRAYLKKWLSWDTRELVSDMEKEIDTLKEENNRLSRENAEQRAQLRGIRKIIGGTQ